MSGIDSMTEFYVYEKYAIARAIRRNFAFWSI